MSESGPIGTFALSKRELEPVFSRLRTKADWHRLAQRLVDFNKLGRPSGVRLSVRSRRGEVIARYESPQSLQTFLSALAARRGHMQAAFAELLGQRAGKTLVTAAVPSGIPRRQAENLRGVLSRDLGVFSDLAPDELWVDLPGSGRRGGAFEELQSALPSSIMLLGEGGSGKTALLQRLLDRWDEAPARVRCYSPLYVAARHLRFDWTGYDLPWAALPGVEPGEAAQLRAAFAEGRLLLLLDGVNDAPLLTDFHHPAVQSFWAAAARNVCVLATLPDHYESQIKAGPLPGIFGSELKRIDMPVWGEKDYGRLFVRMAEGSRSSGNRRVRALGSHLDRLSAQAWQKGWDLLRRTPLSGLACANFVASHEGRKLPRNEYEMMEHMLGFHLRHERGKGGSPLFLDTVQGFLSKLAWQAYVDGLAGQWYVVSFDTASRVLRENFPLLSPGQQSEVLAAVVQLPYLDRDNGSLSFNPHFTDFLVAREILRTMVAGDFQRLRQALGIPWVYANMSRTLFQGIRCLDEQEKKRYLRTCEALFRMIWQEYLRDRSFRQEVAMAYVLQPLGFLDLPETTDFLLHVYETAGGECEFVAMSCGLGFAWHKDRARFHDYIRRLRTSKKAARFNLQFYLFFRRTDRLRMDLENFTPELIGDWGATCDWLLEAALREDPDFRPLRALYAFTLCNFLKNMGPGPFVAPNGASRQSARRREDLARVIAFWSEGSEHRGDAALQAQVKDLVRSARAYGIYGGKRNGSKRTTRPLSAAAR